MKPKLKPSLIRIVIVFMLSPCIIKAQQEANTNTQQIQQLLVAHKWQLHQFVSEKEGIVLVNHLTRIKECEKDNELLFRSDGTYLVYPALDRCSIESDEEIGCGSWQLNTEQGLTMLLLNGESMHRKIDRLDSGTLVLTNEDKYTNTLKWTYKVARPINPKKERVALSDSRSKDQKKKAAQSPIASVSEDASKSKSQNQRDYQEEPDLKTHAIAQENNGDSDQAVTTPQPEPSFKSKWFGFKIYGLLGYRTLNAQKGFLEYSYQAESGEYISGSEDRPGSSGGLAYNFGIDWEHSEKFYLQAGYNGVTGNQFAQGLHAGLGLVLGEKRIFWKPGLMFTWQYARINLGNISSSYWNERIIINGNTFIDQNVDVDIVSRTWGFQPQLNLDMKIYQNWGLRVNVGLYIPIRSNSEWEFYGVTGYDYNDDTNKNEPEYDTVYQGFGDNTDRQTVYFNEKAINDLPIKLQGVFGQIGFYYSFLK